MKLKSNKKNIIVLTGLLLLGSVALPSSESMTPSKAAENIIIDGFSKPIPSSDLRSLNDIIDQVLILINNNEDHFRKLLVHKKIANPNKYLADFIILLDTLKKQPTVAAFKNMLNANKDIFNTLTPNVINGLMAGGFKTLNNLNTRFKRNK